jgi:hypothetical protein
MINQLYNLKKFIGMFDIAQQSSSQEIRLSITELSLIISDINKLLSTVPETKNKLPINNEQIEIEFDGGTF